MVLDLMEAGRPAVDETVLRLLTSGELASADFGQTTRGECRLGVNPAHRLAAMMPALWETITPVVEAVAAEIGRRAARRLDVPTPLTASKAKAAQARARRDPRWHPRSVAYAEGSAGVSGARDGSQPRRKLGKRVKAWTREAILDAILRWRAEQGRWPAAADWSPSTARRRGQHERVALYYAGIWPDAARVGREFGGWRAAIAAAEGQLQARGQRTATD
ncbi:MAG: hypothetical protein ACYCUM_13960 [Solirubrobacteraceae bacterium]